MTQPYSSPGPAGPPAGPPQFRAPGYGTAPRPYPVVAYPPTSYPHTGYASVPTAQILRRPAVVTMAATMAVTASLQFICALSFVWLVVWTGLQSLPSQDLGADSALYHLLNRFNLAMTDGLAWPLYLIPTASFVLGFLVLVPRPWTRWALTLLGLGSLVWSGYWLHRDIVWWIPAALYILIACLILWTPGASAWFRAKGRPVSP